MTRVVVTASARAELDDLIRSHNLPADTRKRFARALKPLESFPELGPELGGRQAGRRFILGPWRWMIVVYLWHEATSLVAILAVIDGRTAESPTSSRA